MIRTALSVETSTQVSTPASWAARAKASVPSTLLRKALLRIGFDVGYMLESRRAADLLHRLAPHQPAVRTTAAAQSRNASAASAASTNDTTGTTAAPKYRNSTA